MLFRMALVSAEIVVPATVEPTKNPGFGPRHPESCIMTAPGINTYSHRLEFTDRMVYLPFCVRSYGLGPW